MYSSSANKRINFILIHSIGMRFNLTYCARENQNSQQWLIQFNSKRRILLLPFSANEDFVSVKHASISGHDHIPRIETKTIAECQESCRKHPRCNSFEVNVVCNDCNKFFCDRSDVNYPKYKVSPNSNGWSIYLLKPRT